MEIWKVKYKTMYHSPIGNITIASDGTNIIGLWNEEQKYHGDYIYKDMVEKEDIHIFDITKRWLDRYFTGKNPSANEIPYGEVITYGDIAKKIAIKRNKNTMSSQAVGGAVGHNPISIIIPCHRVVGENGSLTGYAGGIEKR
jgi:methylated-DNA-[protein]-cysteine S-methyltransferase